MISTEPVRMIRRYPTGAVPCEKIAFPAGNSSSSATAATRASAPAPTASNGGGEASGLDAGPVLGQDRGPAAAQRDEVGDGNRAAQEPEEDERPPSIVPM